MTSTGPWLGTCPATGKIKHPNRKSARAVRKKHPEWGAMSIYACNECQHYHLGHLPLSVRRGKYDKRDYLEGNA